MTRRPLVVAATIVALWGTASPVAAAESVIVVDGLAFPAGITFTSDGTMFVSERAGRLVAFEPSGERRTVGSVPTVTQGETGLLGIAASPDDRHIYAFATETDGTNTVWRFLVSGDEAPERVVTGLPGGTYHNGGGVAFGPDGMLYVSNGETHTTSIAQDPEVLGGKIYRYTPDGEVPEDNPFGGSPAFAVGYRNPFGIAIDPVTGSPFVTENGPESHDEINRVVQGGNGGWPVTSGRARGEDTSELTGDYQDPIVEYPDIIVPTGIAFAPDDASGGDLAGDLFFGAFGEQTIHRVSLDTERVEATGDEIFYESREPVVAVAWGPRGLYFSTPDSVQLIEADARPDAGSETGPASPAARDVPPVADEDGEPSSWIPFVLLGGAAAILVGALFYAFGPKRRGRA